MSSWSLSASTFWIVVIGLVWLVAAWLCWANWHRRGGRAAAALEGFRLLIMTLIAFTLCRPEWVRRVVEKAEPEIVILQDGSDSMRTRDVALSPERVVPREEWLAELRRTNGWQALATTATVVSEEFARSSTNQAEASEAGTDLNGALDAALERQRHVKAVLLLTDGDWNLGKSPLTAAMQYRTRRIPIYAIGVGAERPLPDLVLEQVNAPAYGLLGEQISIPFQVQSHLPREVKTVVSLTAVNEVDVRKELIIPPFARVQDAMIWAPRTLGAHTLNLRLPVEPEEYLSDNNDRGFRIAVRTEKLRVLVVESRPRWEYRFLRNALSRDPGVEVDCLLLHPGMERGQGKDYITAFPRSKELVSKYDVVFLGDVGLGDNELTSEDAELLKGLVEQQGSGLVFLPGTRGRQLTFLESALADLLPVVYDREKRQGIAAHMESRLVLTSSGRGHFLTMLASDPARNEAIWKSLPGFYWCAAVEKSRPGADVLAVHGGLRTASGKVPLLVTRSYGSGEVLFMGTDSAWRWRKGVEDMYHYRFWGQVVRWMSHKRHMAQGEGVRLAYSPEAPRVGENLFLQATILDLSGTFAESETVQGRIEAPSGKMERLEFRPVSGGWGVFNAALAPQEGGTYRVAVSSGRSARSVATEILVTKPQREKLGQPANLAILREITRLTGGSFGGIQEVDRLLREVSLLPEAEPAEKRLQLWANPWWGTLLLLLLAIYWTARKVAGMI